MNFLKTISNSHHRQHILRHIFPTPYISGRPFSSPAAQQLHNPKEKSKCRKPLSHLFKQPTGSSKNHLSDQEPIRSGKILRGRRKSGRGIGAVVEDEVETSVYQELSTDMQVFASFLHERGYLKNANYGKLDLMFAGVKFGSDHQEISKWLSASNLRKVASFGCPSIEPSTVHAAKHLRKFFKIEETKVCQGCIMRDSCKLANKGSSPKASKLYTSLVMRVLIKYALESVPQQLIVPEEIKSSVSLLVKEATSLSKTVS